MLLAVYGYRLFSSNSLGKFCGKRRMLGNKTELDLPALGFNLLCGLCEVLFFKSNLQQSRHLMIVLSELSVA